MSQKSGQVVGDQILISPFISYFLLLAVKKIVLSEKRVKLYFW